MATRIFDQGTAEDGPNVARLLAAAFDPDPVSTWIERDAGQRRRWHRQFFLAIVEQVLQQQDLQRGDVQLLQIDRDRYAGVALWLDADTTDTEADLDLEPFQETMGPAAFARFQTLNEQIHRHHPPEPHAYLPFIGVAPQHQGQGIGTLLLETKLEQFDDEDTPVFLVASNEGSRRLYVRHGFVPLPDDDSIRLPDGPSMYPMWRKPRRQRLPGNSGRWYWPS